MIINGYPVGLPLMFLDNLTLLLQIISKTKPKNSLPINGEDSMCPTRPRAFVTATCEECSMTRIKLFFLIEKLSNIYAQSLLKHHKTGNTLYVFAGHRN